MDFLNLVKTMDGWLEDDKIKRLLAERRQKLELTATVSGKQIADNLGMKWNYSAEGGVYITFTVPELSGYILKDDQNGAGSPWWLIPPGGYSGISIAGLSHLLKILISLKG